MFRIAICDDEAAEYEKLKKILEAYCRKYNEPDFAIDWFENAEILLTSVKEEKYEPDLVLMDIYMPGKLGIEAAMELRTMGNECEIIFLTVSREYALEAFGVDAAQYLLKPVTEENLFPALKKLLDSLGERQKKYLLLEGSGRVHRVALRDIIYCEAQRKSQCIYVENSPSLTLWMTMAKIFGLLSEYHEFARVGAAYIVNLEHIESMNGQELMMDNGKRIYLPRGSYRALREKYFDYYCRDMG